MRYGSSDQWRWGLTAGVCLAFALYVHVHFVRCVIDPVFQLDSPSYFLGAVQSLSGLPFQVPAHRTYGYPLFLLAILRLGGTFNAVILVQHGLAFVTAAIAGVMAHRDLRAAPLTALLAAFFFVIMPPTVVIAHSILSETLYGVLFMATLFLLFRALEAEDSLRWWTAAGFSAAAALIVRPVGWSLIAVLGIAVFLQGQQRFRWKELSCAAVALLSLALPVCALSSWQRGFFGLDRFMGVSLFGPTARYLNLSDVHPGPLRTALEPFYLTEVYKRSLQEANWVRYDPAGPVRQMEKMIPTAQDLDHVLIGLSVKAALTHPGFVVVDQARLAWEIVGSRNEIPGVYRDMALSLFVYRGALIFENAVAGLSAGASLAPRGLSRAKEMMEALNHLRSMPDAQAEARLNQLQREDMYRGTLALRPLLGFEMILRNLRWLPWLALVSAVVLFVLRVNARKTGLLVAAIVLHVALSNFAGDADRRHLVPVEPLFWALLMAGFSALIHHWRTRC